MGYFGGLFGYGRREDAAPSRIANLPIEMPGTDSSNLKRIVLADILGSDITSNLPMSRGEALSIPAVAAASNLLSASIPGLPLVAFGRDGKPLDTQPSVFTRTNGQPLYVLKGLTVQDLLFDGVSLWRCKLGTDGFPLSAEHIAIDRWSKNTAGQFVIDGKVQNPDEMYFIQSLFAGLLNIGSRTLRAARDVELTIATRALNSAPVNVLKNVSGDELDDALADDVVAQFNASAKLPGGATVLLPDGLDFQLVQDTPNNFLLEARNAFATDIARLVGLPSSLLESSSSIDSLAYTTEKGQRSRFEDFSLNLWLDPIESRLSQSDFTPNGTRVAFDTSNLTDTSDPTAGPEVFSPRVTPEVPTTPERTETS